MISKKIEKLLEKRQFANAKLLLQRNKNKFSHAEIGFYLGLIHQLNGEDREAVTLYLEAISHNPTYFAAAQNLILLLSPDLGERARINSLVSVFDRDSARKLLIIAAKASKSLAYIDHDMNDLSNLTICELETLGILKLLNKEYEDSVKLFKKLSSIKKLDASNISNFSLSLDVSGIK